MKLNMLCATSFLATQLFIVPGMFGQATQIIQDSSEQIEKSFSCGEYFMHKVAALGLEFNRFFNDPYFIFKDCDGQEQRVFIACGCGATGYEITKYGRMYLESENKHPELTKLVELLENALRAGALLVAKNQDGEMVYEVFCS